MFHWMSPLGENTYSVTLSLLKQVDPYVCPYVSRSVLVSQTSPSIRVPRKTTWYCKIIVTVNFPVVN